MAVTTMLASVTILTLAMTTVTMQIIEMRIFSIMHVLFLAGAGSRGLFGALDCADPKP